MTGNGHVKVSLLDLTVDQVETLETETGKPIDQWMELPGRMALYRRIYGMVTGDDDETVGRMKVRDLIEAIDMGATDETEVAETANPTVRPTP